MKTERSLTIDEIREIVRGHVRTLSREAMAQHPHDFRDIIICTLVTTFSSMPDEYFNEMMRYESENCGHNPDCQCQKELPVPSMNLFKHLREFQAALEAKQEEGETTVQE